MAAQVNVPRERPSLACQRVASFAATVLPVPPGRLARPCGRSAYAYTPSGRSPAQSAASGIGVPGWRRRNLPPMAPRELGSRSTSSSFPPRERRVSSRAIRRRSATHGFVAGYRSSPCLRLATSAAHRRRPVPLRSLLGRVPRPRPNITSVLFACFRGGLPPWARRRGVAREQFRGSDVFLTPGVHRRALCASVKNMSGAPTKCGSGEHRSVAPAPPTSARSAGRTPA